MNPHNLYYSTQSSASPKHMNGGSPHLLSSSSSASNPTVGFDDPHVPLSPADINFRQQDSNHQQKASSMNGNGQAAMNAYDQNHPVDVDVDQQPQHVRLHNSDASVDQLAADPLPSSSSSPRTHPVQPSADQASTSAVADPDPQRPQRKRCSHWQGKLDIHMLEERFTHEEFQRAYRLESVKCCECNRTYDRQALWACCFCRRLGDLRCGRTKERHSAQHYRDSLAANEEPLHCIAINIYHKTIFCYACNEDLMDDDVEESGLSHIRTIVERLKDGQVTQPEEDDEDKKPFLELYANPQGGLTGLANLGNTCFMSAGLQALLHCPPLIAFCSELHRVYPRDGQVNNAKERLVADFALLLRKIWGGQYSFCAPRDILRDILAINPYFRGYGQHDSQEFIRCFLDNMHEALKVIYEYDHVNPKAEQNTQQGNSATPNTPSPLTATPPANGTTAPAAASTSSSSSSSASSSSSSSSSPAPGSKSPPKKRWPESSLIAEMFSGSLHSSVRCSNCGAVSTVVDPFYDISLEIPKENQMKKVAAERGSAALTPAGKVGWFGIVGNYLGITDPPLSLQSCLHSFVCSDGLSHQDQYKCEKCKLKVDATKFLAIAKLPEVLAIHLKRFSHNTYYSSKVGRYVSFPLYNLDMNPYLAHTNQEYVQKNSKQKQKSNVNDSTQHNGDGSKATRAGAGSRPPNPFDDERRINLYDLFAVVRHIGGVNGGHYVCYAKNHVTNQWFEFDDKLVSEVSEERVSKVEAYMLFYRRHTDKRQIAQAMQSIKDATLMSPGALTNTTDLKEPLRYISRSWIKKIEFLGRAGTNRLAEPIDNRDLCCVHGKCFGLPDDGGEVAVAVQLGGWRRLHSMYGGGPEATGVKEECEACQLPIIRAKELKQISDIDVNCQRTAPSSDPFFIIDTDWLQSWRNFVNSSGDRPGPICNERLYEEDGKTFKEGLQKGVHYRGLHGAVWRELLSIYGGGPEIVRGKLNIYDPPWTEAERIQVEEEIKRRIADDEDNQPPPPLPKRPSRLGKQSGADIPQHATRNNSQTTDMKVDGMHTAMNGNGPMHVGQESKADSSPPRQQAPDDDDGQQADSATHAHQ